MAVNDTWLDKLAEKEYMTYIRRFATGVLLAASAGNPPITILMGVVATVISGIEFHYDRRSKQKALLNLYKDEVGALQGKAPEEVTLKDLEKAAAPKEKGGNGITAIKAGLDSYQWDWKFRWAANLISTAIVVAALYAIPMAMSSYVTNIIGLGVVGFGWVAVNKTVRAIGEAVFGHQDRSEHFNRTLIDICKQIKQEPASPADIFGLMVEVNPQLQKQVTELMGRPYEELTILQKEKAIAAFEPEYRVAAMTQAINDGTIKPSLIGFVAYDQLTPELPEYGQYQKLFHRPVISQQEIASRIESSSSYVERLLSERQNTPGDTDKTLH